MICLKNALMCLIKGKKVKLYNYDCLPIFMQLYLMLYIMLAYLMLLYLMLSVYIIFFLLLIFAIAFCLHALSWFIDT